ncbi:MAG: hypothetical protein KIT84_31905 [Labilithrix sp.]|nr:hypothetical protein [Labilithrix sp.]MCW5815676.1 hypothetical protein [Labilithrix sp.]
MRRDVVVALVVGLGAVGATVGYAAYDARRALLAWVAAASFVAATGIGALVLVFAFHLVNARWWLAVRAPFVATARTLVLAPLFFAPILLAPVARGTPLVVLRVAPCILAWAALGAIAPRAAASKIAAPGLIVLAFTLTAAAFELFHALEPGWISNAFGLYVFAGGLVAALAIAAVTARGTAEHDHALGRLLLCALLVWAYLAFFHLLLVWLPNLPREVGFYRARASGTWTAADTILGARFVVPFLALLPRAAKRSRAVLAAVGAFVLAGEALDFAWLILPSAGGDLSWLDAFPFLAAGGLAWAYGANVAATLPAPAGLAAALRYEAP